MSTELARVEFTSEQVALVKRTIAKDLTDDELNLFLAQCRRTGLDPFAKQIHATKRNNKMVIQTAIDGYRLIADRTERYAGSDDPVFDNEENPHKATVTVYKIVAGTRCAFTASARWNEYYPGEKLGFMWDKMPCVMLGKCAEALALRKAFPQDLSGIYTDDEMNQAAPAEQQRPREEVRQISYGPRASDHLAAEIAIGRAAIARAATVEQLGGAWAAMSRQVQAELEGEKNARKAALTPAPAAKEGEERADPTAPPIVTPSTTPPESPHSSVTPADGIEKVGRAIVNELIPLMHELGVSWPEVRDGKGDKAIEIANAAALPKLPASATMFDLSAAEGLRLKGVLEPLVAAKKASAAKRVEGAARKAREEDPVPA